MAVVQQFINSSTSNQPEQQINVGKISSMDKFLIEDVNDASRLQVGIKFSMDLTSPVREISLTYPGTKAAATILRDASFSAIETAIAQTTV
jgi:hypothetical protein